MTRIDAMHVTARMAIHKAADAIRNAVGAVAHQAHRGKCSALSQLDMRATYACMRAMDST